VQTLITRAADEWSIARFPLLAAPLRQECDESVQPIFPVVTIAISWGNLRSGANGDYQQIHPQTSSSTIPRRGLRPIDMHVSLWLARLPTG
jgi:hypothetical protein